MLRFCSRLPILVIAIGSAGCGTTSGAQPSGPVTPSRPVLATPMAADRGACPRAVLYVASTVAPVKQVLLAAQRLLARQRYSSQGTVYRLTPRNAPIDEVFRTALIGTPLDETQPGLIAIHRAGARLCGERTAQASWAIHYWIPVSVIVGTGAWTYIVKTRTGWRFWGNWCGAGKPRNWRNAYC
jgi:hypothetical protein